MINQQIPVLLILMLLITPIVSAVDNCSAMDMTGHLLESQSLTVIVPIDNAGALNNKQVLKRQQNIQADMVCHTSNSCTFHACGIYGIASSVPTVNKATSSYYSNYEYTSPYSTALSPKFRPPILTL